MKIHHWLSVMITLGMLGCQSQAPSTQPAAPGPASVEQVQSIRASYKAQNPNIEVGVVDDVLAPKNLAAVSDVALNDLKPGDVVCFIDSATNPLVCGKIVRITEDQVHVKYENPTADRRAPMKGDLAVIYR